MSCGLRINPEYSDVETDLYNPCARFPDGVTGDLLGDTLPEGIEGCTSIPCASPLPMIWSGRWPRWRAFWPFPASRQVAKYGGGHLMTRKDYDVEHLIALLKGFKERYPNLELIMERVAPSLGRPVLADNRGGYRGEPRYQDGDYRRLVHLPYAGLLGDAYKPAIRFATDAVEGNLPTGSGK